MDTDKPQDLPYEDFAKLDIRTGTITKAAHVPKSKRLLQLEIFFGEQIGHRTILAGIAESYTADSLVGQQVVAVLNLAPREMMGITSHGMLLAGKWESGHVNLVKCDSVKDGGSIG